MTSLMWALLALSLPASVPAPVPAPVSASGLPPSLDIYFHADLDGRLASPSCGRSAEVGREPAFDSLVRALDGALTAEPTRPWLALLGPNAVAPDLFTRRLFHRDPTAAAQSVAALFHRARYVAYGVGSHELGWDPAWLEAYVGAMGAQGLRLAPANVSCNDDARRTRPAYCAAVAGAPLLLPVPGVGQVALVQAISPRLGAGLAADRRQGLTLADGRDYLRSASAAARRAGAALVIGLVDVPTGSDGLDELKEWQSALADGDRPDVLLAAGMADDEGTKTVRLLRQDGAPLLAGSTTGARGWTRVRFDGEAHEGRGQGREQGRGPRTAEVATFPAVQASAPPAASSDGPADANAPGNSTGDSTGNSGVIANPPDADVSPATSVAATLKPWIDDYCAVYGRPLGAQVKDPVSADDFVTYVLEVMRREARAEVALLNRRFVKRSRFPWRGQVTEGDWAQALPYSATLGLVTLTGAQVQSLLGPARAKAKLAEVGMPREGTLLVNGRPLDATRSYRIATISFVADGGDALFERGALPWQALPHAPDVAELVHASLAQTTAPRDSNGAVDLRNEFGRPVAERPLVVALTDLDAGLSNTSVDNGANYTDAQLARAAQRALKADWNTVVTLRAPEEDIDGRLRAQYGWTRTQPAGQPAVSGESLDLVTGTLTYNDRRLRKVWHPPDWITPDPYARLFLESEITRPAVTATQSRTYHHAELTATVGASVKPLSKLRLRVGPGARRELLAPGAAGDWRFALEAGATLEPVAVATVGVLPVRLEGNVDYFLLAPTTSRAQQLRTSARLTFPLLPRLYLAIGIDLYGAQYGSGPWDVATDTTASLRVHWDRAYQAF